MFICQIELGVIPNLFLNDIPIPLSDTIMIRLSSDMAALMDILPPSSVYLTALLRI